MDFPLWQKAAGFAARAHRHQLRKDGKTPYVAHVVRVALTARDRFGCGDEAVLAAALLHDTIEDTGTDYDELQDEFGVEVADLVAALTKNAALPEPQREADYDRRLAAADWRARLIKLADQYDNLCDTLAHRGEAGYPNLGKAIEKARRAVDLARGDADRRPSVAAGLESLSGLIDEAERELARTDGGKAG